MKHALTFCLGFAAAICFVAVFEGYTWHKTLISVGCVMEGREGVWGPKDQHLCVDMSTAYPADEALDRAIARIYKVHAEKEAFTE